ncbi:hypothetical protein BSKO_00941 [Bryopsis sp. KO-2023]|nr:hypothetical protein BSKO_00941 [Bryopsis sp. KO-2023]
MPFTAFAMNGVRRGIFNLTQRSAPSFWEGCWLSTASAPAELLQKTGNATDRVATAFDPERPFGLVREEVDAVSERMRQSVVSEIPALDRASEYFFKVGSEGKRLRPCLALMLSTALAEEPLPPDRTDVDLRPPNFHVTELRRRQQRIAEIAETIHVASLLHDDVIDSASTRRGVDSLNIVVGNKLAILAGDFLLARVSVTLAALRTSEVIELISNILENLVTGEIMQMTSSPEELLTMDFYLEKTYRKTAALMANTSKSVAILADQPKEVCQLATDFGTHLGMAFQIIDDILDFTASKDVLGKPALNDLRSGIATAPVLLAVDEFPGLKKLVERKFRDNGDIEEAVKMVERSQGIQRARDLAAEHGRRAAAAIHSLPPARTNEAAGCRDALIHLTELVLKRSK